jgi:DNA-binding transcriptional LysR family regulator
MVTWVSKMYGELCMSDTCRPPRVGRDILDGRRSHASHLSACSRSFELIETVALDQLRMLVASVEEGSFSAAGRRLGRTQSVVSEGISQLESLLNVQLFDRSGRYPRLTMEGASLMGDARSALAAADSMKARARAIAAGVEVEVAAALDIFVPLSDVADAAIAFRETFPSTPLRLYVEALGATAAPVLDGRAGIAILGSLPTVPTDVLQERVGQTAFIWVASRSHPLAAFDRIPRAEVSKHVQVVLSDRSEMTADRDYGVLSPLTWQVSDIHAKKAMLDKGVGWGGMPLHMVEKDVAEGRLLELSIEEWAPERLMLPLTAIYRSETPPGPGARWLLDFFKDRLGST